MEAFFSTTAAVSGGLWVVFTAFIMFAAQQKILLAKRDSIVSIAPAVMALNVSGIFLLALGESLAGLGASSPHATVLLAFRLPAALSWLFALLLSLRAIGSESRDHRAGEQVAREAGTLPLSIGTALLTFVTAFRCFQTIGGINGSVVSAGAATGLLSFGCSVAVVCAVTLFSYRGFSGTA